MDAKFSLGNIGITDWIIVQCRKVSDPGAVIASQSFAPIVPTTQNIVFAGLDPDFYYFDVYESVDGTTLSSLFNTFEISVLGGTDSIPEFRRYVVDRGNTGDPVQNTTNLDDPYLDGKTIIAVFQRGNGPLALTDEWTRTSTGIALVAPLTFANQDMYFIEIAYPVTVSPAATKGPFSDEMTITADATLDSTFYNKLINCNGAGNRLTISLDHVGTVPDGTQFLFIDQEGGSQIQTKFVTQSGEFIKWRGLNMSELWIGKGEWVIIKKKGTSYKVVQAHEGLNLIGLRFSATFKTHPNTLPENSALYYADDYPRPWWWVTTQLPGTHYVIDDNVDQSGYVRPVGHSGQFIISNTKRIFRMPITEGLTEKGLHSFTTYNTDPDRPVDYPGGNQAAALMTHTHDGLMGGTGGQYPFGKSATTEAVGGDTGGVTAYGKLSSPPYNSPGNGIIGTLLPASTENTVRNIGVIYLRCI